MPERDFAASRVYSDFMAGKERRKFKSNEAGESDKTTEEHLEILTQTEGFKRRIRIVEEKNKKRKK